MTNSHDPPYNHLSVGVVAQKHWPNPPKVLRHDVACGKRSQGKILDEHTHGYHLLRADRALKSQDVIEMGKAIA